MEKERLAESFREVVGTIVILADPLSIVALAKLLDLPEDNVSCRLNLLHSVLDIPTEKAAPVRLLHLSFRDFLVNPQKRGKSPFWVDESVTHGRIARRCVSESLRTNLCDLKKPGTLRTEIDSRDVNQCLPAEVRYACRYWVHHLEQSSSSDFDSDQIYTFRRKHLFRWLEAMSLLGCTSESIRAIITLQSVSEVNWMLMLGRTSLLTWSRRGNIAS